MPNGWAPWLCAPTAGLGWLKATLHNWLQSINSFRRLHGSSTSRYKTGRILLLLSLQSISSTVCNGNAVDSGFLWWRCIRRSVAFASSGVASFCGIGVRMNDTKIAFVGGLKLTLVEVVLWVQATGLGHFGPASIMRRLYN